MVRFEIEPVLLASGVANPVRGIERACNRARWAQFVTQTKYDSIYNRIKSLSVSVPSHMENLMALNHYECT